jgi:hypothetical protein
MSGQTPVAACATAEAFWRAHHEAWRAGGCGSALNFARQLPNALSGIPLGLAILPLIQLAPTPLVTV